jgi:hypothetical protein
MQFYGHDKEVDAFHGISGVMLAVGLRQSCGEAIGRARWIAPGIVESIK